MTLDGNTIILLCVGALVLALIAVLIDRLNFPQTRFRAKQIKPAERGTTKDRTGAHIIEVDPEGDAPPGAGTGRDESPTT